MSAALMTAQYGGAASPTHMDYIKLTNRFWNLHKEHSFSTAEIALYLHLLHVCNCLSWKNPFQQSNVLLCASLGLSEKTLIAARAALQKSGLVDFTPGHKKVPTTYRLAAHGFLYSQENTLEKFQYKLQPIQELTSEPTILQLPNTLENVASSLNKTTSSKNQTEEDARASSLAVVEEKKVTLPSESKSPVSGTDLGRAPSVHADAAQLTTADVCALLNNPAVFKAACLDINPSYSGIDFEHYRLEMRFDSLDKQLNLMPFEWRKRLRNWLTNAKGGRNGLILAAVAGQTKGDPRAIKPLATTSSASPSKKKSWS